MALEIRWGILGTGKIASDFVLALTKYAPPGGKVVAVASRSKDTATQFASAFKIPKAYGSYQELASDPEVHMIYISTLNPCHKENVLMCLKGGKGVLCEKPLAINYKETQLMVDIAKQNRLFFMEGMWTRYFPLIQHLKKLINDGTLGTIKVVTCDFGFNGTHVPRLTQLDQGGGALLDIGVYVIALASMIFGHKMPSRIQATGCVGPTKVDLQDAMTLVYDSDQVAMLTISFLCPLGNEATIYGTKGKVHIHKPFWAPTKMTLSIDGKDDQVLEFPLPTVQPGDVFNFTNSVGLSYEVAHVHKLLQKGEIESDQQTLEESLIIMKVMDEVRRQVGVKYPWEEQ